MITIILIVVLVSVADIDALSDVVYDSDYIFIKSHHCHRSRVFGLLFYQVVRKSLFQTTNFKTLSFSSKTILLVKLDTI